MHVPESVSAELRPIGEEVARVEESTRHSAQGQFEQMKLWRATNLLLGVPATGLSAAAGGTFLADAGQAQLAGALALIAAALTAVSTTVNAARRAEGAGAAANSYLDLQTDARQLLLVDLPHLTFDEGRERLSQLTQRRSEVNANADPPSRWARRKAEKNLAEGGQDYEIDRSAEGA
ncbi:SLATT domain-containing protein [Streptomyces sp. 1331.2]|uniref:SLATT domain-containing protein n=1 Tax=Streptomyces sp. 1331.2 TaxID=1938835 RepID=UPI000BE3E808|nr:SLATT domain-containing protein [Streptomyces sp. 1331.2]